MGLTKSRSGFRYSIKVSYCEVYNEDVFDLIGKGDLKDRPKLKVNPATPACTHAPTHPRTQAPKHVPTHVPT